MEFKSYDIDTYTEIEVLPKKNAFQKTVFPTICISTTLIIVIFMLFLEYYNILGLGPIIVTISELIYFVSAIGFLIVFPIFFIKLVKYNRSKNLFNSLPVITLTESGKVLYTTKYIKYTLSKIKICEDALSTKTFNITGSEGTFKRTIKISHYIIDLDLIKSIVNTFIAIEKAKLFTNPSFKILLQLYSDNYEQLYSELNNIPFLLPIHYHLDTNVKTSYYHTLKNNTIISFPTLVFEEEIYIPVYSCADKVELDSFYKECLIYNFNEIPKIIIHNNQNTSDLFNAKETIQGIIINPNTDHVVIRLNTYKN